MHWNFFEIIKTGGFPLLFLLIFLEGNPVVGSFIPGQFLVVILGFLISTTGIFNLSHAILLVFIAGFLGDVAGFYFGKKYGIAGLKTFGISEESSIYTSSCNFFKKFAGWSVILGREFNLTRAFIPFFAGLLKMRPLKFVFLAFISNILWSLLSIYLGFYFGYVVIEKIQFLFRFLLFMGIYLGLLYGIYRSFKSVYIQNKKFIQNYAIHNIVYVSFLFLFFYVMILINKYNFVNLFNSYFSFFYIAGLGHIFGFLFSKFFLILIVFITILILAYKSDFRFIVVFIEGMLISSFLTLIFDLLLKRWTGVFAYFSVIIIVFLVFYVYSIFGKVYFQKRWGHKPAILLAVLLIFSFLVKFSLTGDFYLVLLSFIIAAIESEIVVLLTHYQILERYFYPILKKK